MTRKLLLVCLAGLLSLPLLAQAPVPAPAASATDATAPAANPDAASREQLLKLFDVMGTKKQIGAMLQSVQQNMARMLQQQDSKLPAKQQQEFAALMSEFEGKLLGGDFFDSMVAQMIPIYQRHFTAEDVDAAIAFYGSPAGQKFVQEQAEVAREYMGVGMAGIQARIKTVMESMHFEERAKAIGEEAKAARAQAN